jgi:uroporphyrinogen-III decarboxylase
MNNELCEGGVCRPPLFVFAATQAIQPETPPENIMAMWKALQTYGIYRRDPD